MTTESRFMIPADHPMLAGHFPGDPIVPGAYLLAWVVDQAQQWLAARDDARAPMAVSRVKFIRPLRPEQSFACAWTPGTDVLRFAISSEAGPIASGTLQLHGRAKQ